MRIDGIICDLDGTIVDSEGVHMEAWNELIRSFGHTPPDEHWHDDCIGLPDTVARDKTISVFPDLAKYTDEIVDRKQDIFRELVVKKGSALAFPGVHERLAALREAGIGLAVGTNSIELNSIASLKASGLAEFFSVIVTIDQVKRGKPEPDIYSEAAKRLGIPSGRCAVLEDSTAGLAAGRAAGCIVVGIENTWKADKLIPSDFVFPDTCKALEWVLATGKETA